MFAPLEVAQEQVAQQLPEPLAVLELMVELAGHHQTPQQLQVEEAAR